MLAAISVVRSTGSPNRVDRGVSQAAEPPAPPDAVALLDGLKPGDVVGDWQVRAIEVLHDRRIAVEFHKGKASFDIWVARHSANPPVRTARYALTFGFEQGGHVPASAEQRALHAIAARVRATENRVPVPKGL